MNPHLLSLPSIIRKRNTPYNIITPMRPYQTYSQKKSSYMVCLFHHPLVSFNFMTAVNHFGFLRKCKITFLTTG